MKKTRKPDEQSVFLNVPYDRAYENIFIALVAALVSLGRIPRCVLEIVEAGDGRMNRIMRMLSGCSVSIHDVSRIGTPVRFNMPFELGIAYALRHLAEGHHNLILMETKSRMHDKVLSDLKNLDAKIHEGKPLLAITCIFETLARPSGNPPIAAAEKLYRALQSQLPLIRHRRQTIFNRHSFFVLYEKAIDLAEKDGLIQKR